MEKKYELFGRWREWTMGNGKWEMGSEDYSQLLFLTFDRIIWDIQTQQDCIHGNLQIPFTQNF